MIQTDGPSVISFSGGRTSGFMLWRCLQASTPLPPDVHVLFANTGCEMPETLDFVRECSDRWRVPITWLEYDLTADDEPTYREVNFFNASRQCEPFGMYIDHVARMTAEKGEEPYLPGPAGRYCSTELKTRVIKRWMRSRQYDYWTNVVGIRHDEPKRWLGKSRTPEKERWELDWPLVDLKTTKADVMEFWARQPFDLQLSADWEGNCDACVIKADWKVAMMFRRHPERADFWLRAEQRAGKQFRKNGLSIAQLVEMSKHPIEAIEDPTEAQCQTCVD